MRKISKGRENTNAYKLTLVLPVKVNSVSENSSVAGQSGGSLGMDAPQIF